MCYWIETFYLLDDFSQYPCFHLKTFNSNQKPDTYFYWVNREAGVPSGGGYVCLGIQISKGTA